MTGEKWEKTEEEEEKVGVHATYEITRGKRHEITRRIDLFPGTCRFHELLRVPPPSHVRRSVMRVSPSLSITGKCRSCIRCTIVEEVSLALWLN